MWVGSQRGHLTGLRSIQQRAGTASAVQRGASRQAGRRPAHAAERRTPSHPASCLHPSLAHCQVADFLGTVHHEFTFTVEEGIDALYDLIWHIESYEQVRGGVFVCVWRGVGCRIGEG